ncbi:hypothetical protein [Tropicibacter oceani]|uniref:Cation/multidrug efflux pump n=1 Tax=Tropicibacter oceani TaxID=3058420 RepID=A0ABY8QKA0_9RHOB|nr:hypothetical protein [Tropicibacter oceani]WGW04433.1 hypothetical protein QF118_02490 [Tropicibacter oceani]
MFALLQLLVVGFVVLTVVYVALSIWSRRVRRAKLINEWNDEGRIGDQDAFVQDGLQEYDESLRRKLILGVYVVPIVVIGTIIYLTNFY